MEIIVSWEPEGRYCSSKVFLWEPEGRYHCTKSMATAPFWFSTEHLWSAIAPFWLSADVMQYRTRTRTRSNNLSPEQMLDDPRANIAIKRLGRKVIWFGCICRAWCGDPLWTNFPLLLGMWQAHWLHPLPVGWRFDTMAVRHNSHIRTGWSWFKSLTVS